MSEPIASNPLDRNPELVVAGVYERNVAASLERVWENVYDWEHLPWLHSQAFGSIEKLAAGDWGWRARVGIGVAAAAEIELVANREGGYYVARTVKGAGAPSEIWTSLDPVAPDRTAIRVEFCVQEIPEQALRHLGKGYVSLYSKLWDQDEGMMQTRERALAARRTAHAEIPAPPALALGRLADLRSTLPLIVEWAGHRFRIVEVENALFAHSIECPHLLGPLGDCEVADGVIQCPWHGYAFDIRSGRCANGRSLRLRRPPRVVVDGADGQVRLEVAHGE